MLGLSTLLPKNRTIATNHYDTALLPGHIDFFALYYQVTCEFAIIRLAQYARPFYVAAEEQDNRDKSLRYGLAGKRPGHIEFFCLFCSMSNDQLLSPQGFLTSF
jgi:hypothetical protein